MLSSLRKFNYVRSGIDMTANGTEFVTLEQLKLFDNATKCSPDNVTIQQSEDGVYSVKKGGITSDKLAGDIITDITSISQGRFPSSEGYNFRKNAIEKFITSANTTRFWHAKNTESSGNYDSYGWYRRSGHYIVNDDCSFIMVICCAPDTDNPYSMGVLIDKVTSDGVSNQMFYDVTDMPYAGRSDVNWYYHEHQAFHLKENDNGGYNFYTTIRSSLTTYKRMYGCNFVLTSDNVISHSDTLVETVDNYRSFYTSESAIFNDGSVCWFNRWLNNEQGKRLFLSSDGVWSCRPFLVSSQYNFDSDEVWNRIENINGHYYYITYDETSSEHVAIEFDETSDTPIGYNSDLFYGSELRSVFINNLEIEENNSEANYVISGSNITKRTSKSISKVFSHFVNSPDAAFSYPFIIVKFNNKYIAFCLSSSVWVDISNGFYLIDTNRKYTENTVTSIDGGNFIIYSDDKGTYSEIAEPVSTIDSTKLSNGSKSARGNMFLGTGLCRIVDNGDALLYIVPLHWFLNIVSTLSTYYDCPNLGVIKISLK